MNTCTPSGTPTTDFAQAWREVLLRHQTRFKLLFSLMRLSRAGARPIPLEDLAADLQRSVPEAEQLVADLAPADRPWFGASLEAGLVYAHLKGHESKSRFRYHFKDRSVGVDGCAPDGFILAYGLHEPFYIESACPVTGIRVRVDFGEDGAVAADPNGTVVAVIHPDTAREALALNDMGRVDADICAQQPFFASAPAAAGWLSTHPGGKALPILEFDRMWRRLLDETQPERRAIR